jgi:hypothetical protein
MRIVSLAVAAAIVTVLSAASTAEALDWKKGKLAHLIRLIGTYDENALLNDPQVKRHLTHLVSDDIGLLKENLAEHGPINFIDGNLVLGGYAAKEEEDENFLNDKEAATLLVRVYDGSVRAAILHDGKVTIYSKDSRYRDIPESLRGFARYHISGTTQDFELPPGVRWQK